MKSPPSLLPPPNVPSTKNKTLKIDKIPTIFLTSLVIATIFSLVFLYTPSPFKYLPNDHKLVSSKSQHGYILGAECDFFQGQWERVFINETSSRSQYTNWSCATIPDKKNCFKHGRQNREFLNWRWKPERCELPGFDPKAFLEIVRGKTLGFVGDSIARNHMDSLLCLLSPLEVPLDIYKDAKDRNRIYVFPDHDFTLRTLWTKFLMVGEERVINGKLASIIDLNLSRVDENWSKDLHNLDYVIISSGQWFFRPMYLHEGSNVLGCTYCKEANVTDRGVHFALRMAFRAALSHINECEKCKGLITLLRTYSPSHFENGDWNTGGTCNRTSPFNEGEIDLNALELELRQVQVEEVERVTRERRQGKYGILDVTKAMLMRPDGHPGAHWRDKKKNGYNDCVHWCLPGPIDLWSDLLLAILQKLG